VTAVFLVVSRLSARPIDSALVTGVSSGNARAGGVPMEPLIAIVDDDKAVRDALQRMLRSHGFATDIFASAEEFLSSGNPNCTACLISDIRMPGVSGLVLHDYLISHGFRVPTILITARPSSAERRRAFAIGVASYLAKPLSEQILLDTVRDALENSRAVGNASLPGQGAPRI
jgi:FixJ family two-component response regulator